MPRKANRHLTLDQKASILIDTELLGVTPTCEKYKTSRQTIKNLREELKTNTDFLQLLTQKKASIPEIEKPQPHTRDILQHCTDFIQRAATYGNPADPEMVHAITGAFKTIADARRADKALEEYLNALRASQTTTGIGPARAQHPLENANTTTSAIRT
jgi:hypothetical protein